MREKHEHLRNWTTGALRGFRFARHALNYPRDDIYFKDKALAFKLQQAKENDDGQA